MKSTVTWRAPEFLFRKKSILWYTHVVLVYFVAFALLLWADAHFGALLVTVLFGVFLAKAQDRPRQINYKIDKTGITIGDHTFAYSEIEYFSVDVSHASPVIILDLNSRTAMPVSMVVKPAVLEHVIELLLNYVPLRQQFSFIRWLTHLLHY